MSNDVVEGEEIRLLTNKSNIIAVIGMLEQSSATVRQSNHSPNM